MGYVYCHSACITCGKVFAYNPHRVPSTRAFTGEREPVCESCMSVINAKRVAMGEEPFFVHPEAYQPLPEGEL